MNRVASFKEEPRRQGVWICVVVAVALFAGCVEDRPSMEPDLPEVGDPIGGPSGPLAVALEGCQKVVMLSGIRSAWAQPFVREGFSVREMAPGTTFASVGVYDCERMVANATVRSDVRLFEIGVWAYREIDGQKETSYFYVDSYTNDEWLYGMMDKLGIKIELVEIVYREEEQAPSVSLKSWEVNGDDKAFKIEFPHTRFVAGGSQDPNFEYWYPGPPHVSVTGNGTFTIVSMAESDQVVVTMEGDSDLRALLGDQEAYGFINQHRWNGAYQLTYKGGFMA